MDQLVEKYVAIPQSQRLLGVLVLLGGVIAVYYYLFYSDTASNLEALRTQYKKQQAARVEKQGIAHNLSMYESKLVELEKKLERARAQLPDSSNVPQLLAQLSNKGRQVGMDIEEFQPKTEQKKGFYAEIAFNVKVRGSYHEIAMFIDSLGRLDRIVNVQNLKLKNPKTENSKVVVEGNFDVTTYRFTDQSAVKGKKKGKK